MVCPERVGAVRVGGTWDGGCRGNDLARGGPGQCQEGGNINTRAHCDGWDTTCSTRWHGQAFQWKLERRNGVSGSPAFLALKGRGIRTSFIGHRKTPNPIGRVVVRGTIAKSRVSVVWERPKRHSAVSAFGPLAHWCKWWHLSTTKT